MTLLVGGIGIANVMVIAVLERRSEIGLRRALGATKAHIAAQFVTESLILGAIGGAAGLLTGVAVTATMAKARHWAVLVPPTAVWGGPGVTVLVGVIAGLYPAARAARLPPPKPSRADRRGALAAAIHDRAAPTCQARCGRSGGEHRGDRPDRPAGSRSHPVTRSYTGAPERDQGDPVDSSCGRKHGDVEAVEPTSARAAWTESFSETFALVAAASLIGVPGQPAVAEACPGAGWRDEAGAVDRPPRALHEFHRNMIVVNTSMY